jgi:hypothetical protein
MPLAKLLSSFSGCIPAASSAWISLSSTPECRSHHIINQPAFHRLDSDDQAGGVPGLVEGWLAKQEWQVALVHWDLQGWRVWQMCHDFGCCLT